MIAGWTIGRLGMEKHVESWVYQAVGSGGEAVEEESMSIADRVRYGCDAVRDIVGKVWMYVVLGIAVGAGIHGYVPENFLASFMGGGAWWSVPLAVLLGIPMYSNAAGIIPVVQALLAKGAAKSLGLEYRMEKVTDIQAIMGFGVMMTPALAVDGVVKVSGKVPSTDEIRNILSV